MLKSSSPSPSEDIRYIQYAVALARKGYPGVFPNPPVGALIVKNGKILAADYHRKAGLEHAERRAISACAPEALSGSTLYVSLEPCAHQGKTPPCTDAIIASGISRVVYGTRDPYTCASGGAEILLQHGIQVESSGWSDHCARFLTPWKRWILEERRTIDVCIVLSLNGLMLCSNDSEIRCSKQATIFLDRVLRRNVQRVLCDISDLDSPDFYHGGYMPGSPEDLCSAIRHPFFTSLVVVRVPVFASESDTWKHWSADVSLKREYVRKSPSLSCEKYSNE
jgi:pyrimidine deaminase RibD-like protein